MLGQTISHYKILGKLGEGGMGVVYKAEDTKLKRTVALKFLPREMTIDAETRERFVHEAQAASALDHPNICTIHEIDETEDGQMFISMGYYEGETLDKKIERKDLTLENAINLATQAAGGLGKAHAQGIVHRDIKPANVMVTTDGTVKLLDFGLAKLHGREKITRTGTTVGTTGYMSPEQVSGAEVDHRSDIFSLGVVLYEMIARQRPFKGDHEAAIMYSILNEQVEPLARYKVGVSEELQRIMDKALEKDPEIRYQHVDELIADLKRERKISSGQMPSALSALARARQRKKSLWYIIGGSAVFIAAVTTVLVIFSRTAKQIVPATHRQMTFVGNAYYPAISSDGKFIAYTIQEKDREKIMVQDASGGKPLEILSGHWFEELMWSPDGSQLLFVGFIDTALGRYMIPRLGGEPMRISKGFPLLSPDGKSFVGGGLKTLEVIDRATGDTKEIPWGLNHAPFTYMFFGGWSPQGDFLMLCAVYSNKYTIYTIRTDGAQENVVLEDSVRLATPRWSPRGDAIYYFRSNGGTKDLMKIPVSLKTGKPTSAPSNLLTGIEAGDYFTLSNDGKHLLYTRKLEFASLSLLAVTGEGSKQKVDTKQLTSGKQNIRTVTISPDGKLLAFCMNDRNGSNVYAMPIEGGNPKQITFMNSFCYGTAWSPDGKQIAFSAPQGGVTKLWTVPAEGGTPRQFADTKVAEEANLLGLLNPLAWSPSNRILYLQPDHRNWRTFDPMTAQEGKMVRGEDSLSVTYDPVLSPDAKKVIVRCNLPLDHQGQWLISLQDGSQSKLSLPGMAIQWSADMRSLYIWGGNKNVMLAPLSGGEARSVATVPSKNFQDTKITPDGKRIVCILREKQSDIWLMENFDPEAE